MNIHVSDGEMEASFFNFYSHKNIARVYGVKAIVIMR